MNGTTLRLVLNRLGVSVLTLLAVSAVIFTVTSLLPGDAAQQALGQEATPELMAAMRAKFGLDQPAHVRYFHWLGGLLSGNPGNALANGLPVAELIGGRLPASLMLAAVTAAVSVPLALTIGILSAMYRGTLFDRTVSMLTVWTVSVPEFLIATIAVLIFAVKLRWLSALSRTEDIATFGQFLRVYAMPVMTLCCVIVAQMSRIVTESTIRLAIPG